jgi:hypothetical protein
MLRIAFVAAAGSAAWRHEMLADSHFVCRTRRVKSAGWLAGWQLDTEQYVRTCCYRAPAALRDFAPVTPTRE